MNPDTPAAAKLTSVPQIPAEATDSRAPSPPGSASTTRSPFSVFMTAHVASCFGDGELMPASLAARRLSGSHHVGVNQPARAAVRSEVQAHVGHVPGPV